jgi:meso-butanediol dehydrogenase/(S,S)-butanediol dehydrogenase/diacetyl reductase
MTRLAGKVALVTGGGTGIGKGIAQRFAAEGMKLAVAGLDRLEGGRTQYGARDLGGYQAARAVAAELGNGAIALEADVTHKDQVARMVQATVDAFGRVDVVVNAAGVVNAAPIAEITESDWDVTLDVNLKGTFFVTQAAVVQMRRQGGGCIQNIASIAGKMGVPTLAHYCGSKWGVIGFSESVAREVAKENITVNCICPGIVGTQMWHMLSRHFAKPGETPEQSYQRCLESFIPQGTEQTVEDMAELAVFLAVSPHVTGQAINVDGGCAR